MKKLFILMFCLIPFASLAQKLPDFGMNKVRIAQPDQTILAEIDPVSSDPSAKKDLFYYWYSAGAVHSTQGGYSGKLLNGSYSVFYLNKNLKEQGNFKKGLKDGLWKNWNEDGTMSASRTWKKGVDMTGIHLSIWRKLNIFRRRQTVTDTLNKVK